MVASITRIKSQYDNKANCFMLEILIFGGGNDFRVGNSAVSVGS
jgi:hypothetical protein